MITINNPIIEKTEKPDKLTPKNVQYYCSHTGELKHSQIHKASIFVELGLIQYDSLNKCYYCLPIDGYNSTTYTLTKGKVGYFCNCQCCRNKIRDGTYNPDIEDLRACSHLMALHFHWKINNYVKNG